MEDYTSWEFGCTNTVFVQENVCEWAFCGDNIKWPKQQGNLKAEIHVKAVFWLGIMFFMQISRLRFKQSRISMPIPHMYVLGRFESFLVILGKFGVT